jgi:elongation factor P hydroxylase
MPRIDGARRFCSARLERVFDACFRATENTRLIGGAMEPVYVPAGDVLDSERRDYHRLCYREDFFASALHEVAHWCIAGRERRQQRDFGYWYAPDGRSPGQQAAFQAVEARPQALEWCLSRACGFRFRVSLDNLDGGAAALAGEQALRQAVLAEARRFATNGLPPRARQFCAALAAEFGTRPSLASERFDLDELG